MKKIETLCWLAALIILTMVWHRAGGLVLFASGALEQKQAGFASLISTWTIFALFLTIRFQIIKAEEATRESKRVADIEEFKQKLSLLDDLIRNIQAEYSTCLNDLKEAGREQTTLKNDLKAEGLEQETAEDLKLELEEVRHYIKEKKKYLANLRKALWDCREAKKNLKTEAAKKFQLTQDKFIIFEE